MARCASGLRLLVLLAVGILNTAAAPGPDTTRHILVLPALRWDPTGEAWSYATEQDSIELARAMSGLTFGMTPEEASGHLPGAGHVVHWNDLPRASEFIEDIRYVWIPMPGAGALRAPVASCFGDGSYIVILFLNNALFRTSWRFMPSQTCPDPRAAAEEVYAAYVPLAPDVAISAIYHTGDADVVDVTDPVAGPLTALRWQMQGR